MTATFNDFGYDDSGLANTGGAQMAAAPERSTLLSAGLGAPGALACARTRRRRP